MEGDITEELDSSNRFCLGKSPINVKNLEAELKYYDHPDKNCILQGFKNGFQLNYAGPRETRFSKNLKSCNGHEAIVSEKIKKECELGRVSGPFVQIPLDNFRISPIGLVPKKAPGEFRLIHHLSYPHGDSVNDFIDPSLASVKYTHFDEAIHLVQDLGKNCHLFKLDLKNAFRLLPVNRLDFNQLGFQFKGEYYFDKCLPFGCSISCSLFEKVATFLEFCVKRRMKSGKILHYLDDSLGGDKTAEKCKCLMELVKNILSHLNVPIAEDKTEGPVTVLTFLGLELDSDEMVVRIPHDKIIEIKNKINAILNRKKCTLREMQSLIGSLNFACRAIAPGRPFCRRLIDSICGLTKPHHYLRVGSHIRLDLTMWLNFFENFNGVSVFHDRFWVSNEEVQLFTDSSGCFGFGIYFCDQWSCAAWPKLWHETGLTTDITVLELFPIVVAIEIWGSELKNKKIKFFCDNMSVVHIINKMSSKSVVVMKLIRYLTLLCLKFNIVVKSSHIEGKRNQICDALSRFQWTKFRLLAPKADKSPREVPSHLWEICTSEHTNF